VGEPYYQDDHCTIYHGDCREVLPGLTADAIVTDPPFKLSQSYAGNVDADNLDAVASIKDTAVALRSALRPGGVAIVIYDNRIMPFGIDAMRRAGWQYLRLLAFYRRWGNAHQLHGWMSTTDPVLVFVNPGGKPTFHGEWRHDCYIRATPEPVDFGHPAQKPADMMRHLVERVTPPGGVVLDPYAGSGSTLVAASQTGRKAIGIEIEERYCEIAAKRLGQEVLF
jgi:site-specific DNA-methyltransferase (adenine-specific)